MVIMAKQAASVLSIDALRRLKAALEVFTHDVADTIIMLDIEARRPMEWIEHDRTPYWPREMRRASDWVSEARLALQRCELSAVGDERRSCYEERIELEKAKRRLRLCEEKIPIVQQWRNKLRKETEEFQVQLARMSNFLEADMPRAMASLERMAGSLERYAEPGQAPRAADAEPST